jgi:aspartate 1-decarboxylase
MAVLSADISVRESDAAPRGLASRDLGSSRFPLDHRPFRGVRFPEMFRKVISEATWTREVLKSKLHRAVITEADVEYEGSIEIPRDLMDAADLWPGEKVLVASITTGARLETYVLEGPPKTGKILINGGAAHVIKKGERVAIMAFGYSESPIRPKNLLLGDNNEILAKR